MSVFGAREGNCYAAASVLQASCFRGDVTVFRLNARPRAKSGSEPAFRRNTAEPVYLIEAAHNPEVAGSNPAPAIEKGPGNRAFFLPAHDAIPTSAGVFASTARASRVTDDGVDRHVRRGDARALQRRRPSAAPPFGSRRSHRSSVLSHSRARTTPVTESTPRSLSATTTALASARAIPRRRAFGRT